jgi:hypothetical protein
MTRLEQLLHGLRLALGNLFALASLPLFVLVLLTGFMGGFGLGAVLMAFFALVMCELLATLFLDPASLET